MGSKVVSLDELPLNSSVVTPVSDPSKYTLDKLENKNAGSKSVISLSNDHGSLSKINNVLRRNITSTESSLRPEERLNMSCKNDMKIYNDLLSISIVPEHCPCKDCVGKVFSLRPDLRSTDRFGFRRITGLSLILSMKDQIEERNGPKFPENTCIERRKESINEEYGSSEMTEIADAGFFGTEIEKRRKTCFYCGLCLCDELLLYDPWREHARWCPVCPYLRSKMSNQYVHSVIEDTKSLKKYYRGLNRPAKMDTDIVEDALKEHTQIVIQESICFFFEENGSFPNRKELFYILEAKKDWKTF